MFSNPNGGHWGGSIDDVQKLKQLKSMQQAYQAHRRND